MVASAKQESWLGEMAGMIAGGRDSTGWGVVIQRGVVEMRDCRVFELVGRSWTSRFGLNGIVVDRKKPCLRRLPKNGYHVSK
jgi:hypothetical protein